jgi:phospholipid/cholesterol/gamma-HCH transport system substrate-binding protein
VRELRGAATELGEVTPRLARTFRFLNTVLNALAYNPRGGEEGYLFWAAWGAHASATLFDSQDAHGPARRGIVLVSCPGLQVLEQVAQTTPTLAVLIELLDAPARAEVCPGAGAPAPAPGAPAP